MASVPRVQAGYRRCEHGPDCSVVGAPPHAVVVDAGLSRGGADENQGAGEVRGGAQVAVSAVPGAGVKSVRRWASKRWASGSTKLQANWPRRRGRGVVRVVVVGLAEAVDAV